MARPEERPFGKVDAGWFVRGWVPRLGGGALAKRGVLGGVIGSRSTLSAYLHLLVNFPRRGWLPMFLGLVGTNVLMRRALEVADMVISDDRMIGVH